MTKTNNPTVALIFGGRGYERDVSIKGADNLFSLIPCEKYEKIPIFIDRDGRFLMSDDVGTVPLKMARGEVSVREVYPAYFSGRGGLAHEGGFVPVDAAFPLLHGNFGEDGVVQGALECARIAYVGCDTLGSAIARDKMLVKTVAKALGIPTARGVLCRRGEENEAIREVENEFSYPVFVKPARLGSSLGASVAENRDALLLALDKALALSSRAIVEEYIDIEKELECAYFAAKGKELFTNLGEICACGFYDYDKKYGKIRNSKLEIRNEENEDSPQKFETHNECAPEIRDFSNVGEEIESTAREYARRLVRMLSLRDLSRIDFFLSKGGRLCFNEINTMPGFTNTSLYLKLVERCGISQAEIISALIDCAIERGV